MRARDSKSGVETRPQNCHFPQLLSAFRNGFLISSTVFLNAFLLSITAFWFPQWLSASKLFRKWIICFARKLFISQIICLQCLHLTQHQIEYFLFSCVRKVPSIDSMCFWVRRVYRGLTFFSLVLILRIRAYLGIKGDQFFSDLGFFSALILCANWCTTICITCPILHKIECIEFVCNEFVLVLVQIDLIQFEDSNCIRSIWTKTYTNSLHTNSIHSSTSICTYNERRKKNLSLKKINPP